MVAIKSEIQRNIFELLDTVLKVPAPELEDDTEEEAPEEPTEENDESSESGNEEEWDLVS